MAIDIRQYVNITSGVGAGAVVPQRQLIGRLFTDNAYLPVQNAPLQFTSATAVGAYFGTHSQEYLRAVFYFGWISKNITTPQLISYDRFVSVSVAPMIFGNIQTQTLETWQAITTGSFGLTIGGVTNTFTNLDFAADNSFSAIASTLQTAVRTGSGTQWTSATVTWNSTTQAFNFVGGATGDAAISVIEGATGVPIATNHIGWIYNSSNSPVNTLVIANGAEAEHPSDALTRSSNNSDNFGSFLFMPETPLTITQNVNAAAWNITQNISYQFYIPVSVTNASAWQSQLSTYGGTGLVISVDNTYPEMMPMMIMAATNYQAANSVQNYEFQQFAGSTPSVLDTATAQSYDQISINYYGQTQTAGQKLSFFQRGVLQGVATDPLDMNTYANEQWLRSAVTAAIMTLLLSVSKISANAQGRGQILTILQAVIDLALFNGTISVGKTLNSTQKLFITQATNDPNAWYQVQNSGYWVDCVIIENSEGDYVATYTLIYSKDDVVRLVNGTHDLI